ncbi:MAG: 2-phospho-L-lactate transferase [Candidatus Heimdallarchaeota archaeon]|nr:2-phospho-L-lactate transferase [Candidatus Heimdallarchaeota archaeon]
MKYSFISGGTGTPKLLQGFRTKVADDKIGVICNTGDDYRWQNLHVSPDLDTVLYLFSSRLDVDKFWGVKDETFHAVNTLRSLGEDIWFNVGDFDLGLHLYRTPRLETKSLTEITQEVCQSWGITADILPMANELVQTQIISNMGNLHFQEYFVKHRTNVKVSNVKFLSHKPKLTPEVASQMTQCNSIIIGPSNPVTSIGPVLSIPPLLIQLQHNRSKVLAVSPIIGNNAFSGPTISLLHSQGIEPSPRGIANYYRSTISKLVLSPSDMDYKQDILDCDIEPIFLNIDLSTQAQKEALAEYLIDLL